MDHAVATHHHQRLGADGELGADGPGERLVVAAAQHAHLMPGLAQPSHHHLTRASGTTLAPAAKSGTRVDGHSHGQGCGGARLRGDGGNIHGKSNYGRHMRLQGIGFPLRRID